MIEKWQNYFGLDTWSITSEKIKHENIDYAGEAYFIGIVRNFTSKIAVIYHDVPLTEESVVHEILHVVFPHPNEDETFQDYERWITEAAENIAK
jgi:hypothetical protein|tara:strand:+ start:318 stop:599 length:282 start_codon:yes stop_codon:yes gene_type:complete